MYLQLFFYWCPKYLKQLTFSVFLIQVLKNFATDFTDFHGLIRANLCNLCQKNKLFNFAPSKTKNFKSKWFTFLLLLSSKYRMENDPNIQVLKRHFVTHILYIDPFAES